MSDVLQAIADVECREAFGQLESDQATTLRRYHQLCVALGESEFLGEDVRFTVKVSPQESYEKLDHAGSTQLRSVMLDLRQLWLQRERTQFGRVKNMLRANAVAKGTSASEEAVCRLDGIGCRFSEAVKRNLMSVVDRANPMVHLEDVCAEQVINDWLYAGAAHWDEDKAARIRRWSKVGYEYSLSKAIHAVCDVCWELDLLIQGILHEDSLVPPLAPHSGFQL